MTPEQIQEACRNPMRFFDKVSDLMACDDIDKAHKIEALKSWEFDARERMVADDENMKGEACDCFDEIMLALKTIQ